MLVEAVMIMVMKMLVMMAAHPGMRVQHARLQMQGLHGGGMLDAALAAGHRRCGENGNCKQGRGNCFEHRCLLTGISEWPAGWTGSSIMLTMLMGAR